MTKIVLFSPRQVGDHFADSQPQAKLHVARISFIPVAVLEPGALAPWWRNGGGFFPIKSQSTNPNHQFRADVFQWSSRLPVHQTTLEGGRPKHLHGLPKAKAQSFGSLGGNPPQRLLGKSRGGKKRKGRRPSSETDLLERASSRGTLTGIGVPKVKIDGVD